MEGINVREGHEQQEREGPPLPPPPARSRSRRAAEQIVRVTRNAVACSLMHASGTGRREAESAAISALYDSSCL